MRTAPGAAHLVGSWRTRVQSLGDDFPVEVPFTTVAKGPIWARLEARG